MVSGGQTCPQPFLGNYSRRVCILKRKGCSWRGSRGSKEKWSRNQLKLQHRGRKGLQNLWPFSPFTLRRCLVCQWQSFSWVSVNLWIVLLYSLEFLGLVILREIGGNEWWWWNVTWKLSKTVYGIILSHNVHYWNNVFNSMATWR